MTKQTVRTAALVLALVLMVGLSVSAKPVEIRISGWSAGPEIEALMRAQLDAFEELNPGIKVRYEPIPVDYLTKIQVMLAASTAPDVFFIDAVYSPQFMSTGALLPLDDYIKNSSMDADMFAQSLLDAFVWDGKIYGLPKDSNTLVVYYNKDLFDANGVEYPNANWTWDDFENAAKTLTNVSGRSIDNTYGLVLGQWPGRWLSFMYQNGGRVLTEDGKLAFTEPEFVEAFRWYTDLYKKGIGVLPSDVGASRERDAFGQGRVAMAVEGGWAIPTLFSNYPDLNWGAAELPQGPVGRGNTAFTVSYSIPKTTKNPDAAWKLIEYLTGEDNQIRVITSGHVLPSMTALFEHPHFADKAESQAVLNGVAYAVANQYGIYSQQIVDELQKAFDAVVIGGKTAEAALQDAYKVLSRRMR